MYIIIEFNAAIHCSTLKFSLMTSYSTSAYFCLVMAMTYTKRCCICVTSADFLWQSCSCQQRKKTVGPLSHCVCYMCTRIVSSSSGIVHATDMCIIFSLISVLRKLFKHLTISSDVPEASIDKLKNRYQISWWNACICLCRYLWYIINSCSGSHVTCMCTCSAQCVVLFLA